MHNVQHMYQLCWSMLVIMNHPLASSYHCPTDDPIPSPNDAMMVTMVGQGHLDMERACQEQAQARGSRDDVDDPCVCGTCVAASCLPRLSGRLCKKKATERGGVSPWFGLRNAPWRL